MKLNKPGNIGPLDACQLQTKIDLSFNIKNDSESIHEAILVGKLSVVIINKINYENVDTCTTQHAFYLLRNAIATTTGTDKCSIMPHTKLCSLFPRENRIRAI